MRSPQKKVKPHRLRRSSAADLFGDRWVKFSQYEIENGRIRPVDKAAMISYEPWSAYGSPVGKQARGQPYYALLALGAVAAAHPPDSDEFKKAALEFADEHGLLGILPHQLEMITLPQRLDETSPGHPFKQTIYVRAVIGWKLESVHSTKPNEPDDFMKRPGAFTRGTGFELVWQPLGDLCVEFFPGLGPALLPLPLSREFWARYSEPLSLVRSAALQFHDAIEDARISPSRSEHKRQQLLIGLTHIQELTVPTRHDLYLDKHGKLAQRWVSNSLLATFAMMAKLDLAKNHLHRCARPDCQTYFVTQAKLAEYCSRDCRHVVQMRRYRKNVELKKKALKKKAPEKKEGA